LKEGSPATEMAAGYFVRLKDPRAVDPLSEALLREHHMDTAARLIEALLEFNDPRVISSISQFLDECPKLKICPSDRVANVMRRN